MLHYGIHSFSTTICTYICVCIYRTSQVVLVVKDPACQCRRHTRRGFDPCVGKIPWRRARQHTPVFLPGGSHEQRSLAGCSAWGPKESDTTARLSVIFTSSITWEAQISYIYIHIYPHLGYHRGQCLSLSSSVSSGPCFPSPTAIM